MIVRNQTRKGRSVGEMISTLCFYGVGIYAILEAMLMRDAGEPLIKCLMIIAAGIVCVMAGARFIIADMVARYKALRNGGPGNG